MGAVPEVIGTSCAARVVAPGSVAGLAEAMERAITEGDSRAAAMARRDVVNRFSLERRVEAQVHLYRELLEESGGVTSGCVESPAR